MSAGRSNNFCIFRYIFSGADILIGGLYTDLDINRSDIIVSFPYFQDDFTWCIQKAALLPWFLSIMTMLSPTVWFLFIFGYAYLTGFILFLFIQFDLSYKQRNNRDWHYFTWLVSVPSIIGFGQRFHPRAWRLRLFYAWTLISMIFCVQLCTVYLYKYLQVRFPKHQITTIEEIKSNGFILMGEARVQRLITADDKVR